MAKILLMIIALIILTLVLVVMYCEMVVAGRSDKIGSNSDNNEGDDKMFWKKKMCPRCKTGKDSYELDKRSQMCPYIGCFEKGECSFFVPLEKPYKKGLFKGLKNK